MYCVILNFKEVGISFMMKGAISFFAFSIFLFGCTAQITYQSPPPLPPSQPVAQPEFTLPDISLDEKEGIGIEGSEVIPEVDKQGKMVEEKESKDDFAKDLQKEVAHLAPSPPPPIIEAPKAPPLLPDLTITNLFLNPKKRLAVTLANIGTSPLPMGVGSLKIFVDGQLKESYGLNSFSDQSFLQPNENITFTTSLTVRGRHEFRALVETSHEMIELNRENNYLERVLEGLPIGPDIVIKDLDLTEDMELSIILSNAGEVDLRKGATFRIRVSVNGLKISEFDHFTSDVLKANFGNDYMIHPPYRVGISGTAKVRIAISPKVPTDDVCLENNILKKTFIIFPFRIIPQAKQEFSFSLPSPRLRDDSQAEKVKAEVRWEGGGGSLMLSFVGPEPIKSVPAFSGKSPLKIEVPLYFEEAQKESLWKVFVTNLIERKVEGQLIIQHP
jgi:hypothetical protein